MAVECASGDVLARAVLAVTPVPYEPPVDPVTGKPINPIKALSAGRPREPRSNKYIPTERERHAVAELAGMAFTHEEIARVLNMSTTLLVRTFDDELFMGKMEKKAAVTRTMFAVATNEDHKGVVTAGKYILSTQFAEWREKSELVGADGKPLSIAANRTVDPAMLSDEQREALRDILSSALRLAGPAAAIEAPQSPALEHVPAAQGEAS